MELLLSKQHATDILDKIDIHADLLDMSITEFICNVSIDCKSYLEWEIGEVLAAVLIEVYGSTQAIIHQIVDLEHWGKWDRFFDYKSLYKTCWFGFGKMFAYAKNGSYNHVGWDPSVVPNVDFITGDVYGDISAIAKAKDIAFSSCWLTADELGPKQKEMYVPVRISKKDGGQKIPERIITFKGHLIPDQHEYVVSSKKIAQNGCVVFAGGYGGCVKINDLLTKTNLREMKTILFTQVLPKEIWEKMGYPIIEL